MPERHSAPSHSKNGTLLEERWDGGPVVQSDTVQCKHCGQCWQFKPGSGKLRGYCMQCGGFTCGPKCPAGQGCVPQEQFLANIESGKPLDHRPIVASVPAAPPS